MSLVYDLMFIAEGAERSVSGERKPDELTVIWKFYRQLYASTMRCGSSALVSERKHSEKTRPSEGHVQAVLDSLRYQQRAWLRFPCLLC